MESGGESADPGSPLSSGAAATAEPSTAVPTASGDPACTPDCGGRCGVAADGCGGSCDACAFTPFTDKVWTWDQVFDACSYSNDGNTAWNWMLEGREPVEAGRYPVFIYLVGTGDVANDPAAASVVESMAARGFVAASVPYASLDGLGAVVSDRTQACGIAAKKAGCIFGSGAGSAVSKLCGRGKADCGRGIVVAGHSQGAMLATLAKEAEPRVRAAYAMGAGVHVDVSILGLNVDADLSACATPQHRALPADRLRIVDGQSDYAYGSYLQQDVRDLTGMDCPPGALECLRAGGSGWTLFPDAESQTDHDEKTGNHVARHCYFANTPPGDCGGVLAK
jgi:hypothetical protein